MDKPLNLVIIDTEEHIIKLLNEMKMPVKVMQMVVDEIKRIVDSQAGVIIINDRKKYTDEMQKESEV